MVLAIFSVIFCILGLYKMDTSLIIRWSTDTLKYGKGSWKVVFILASKHFLMVMFDATRAENIYFGKLAKI